MFLERGKEMGAPAKPRPAPNPAPLYTAKRKIATDNKAQTIGKQSGSRGQTRILAFGKQSESDSHFGLRALGVHSPIVSASRSIKAGL